ncbi:MAG: NAD(P)H-hydrate dehydratase [Bacteroidales bacterium]
MAIKIYTTNERRGVDAYTIQQQGISSFELMERAGQQCAYWIMSRYSRSHPIYIFCGKGNNGGDGWVIARHLAREDYRVTVYHLFSPDRFSDDARINYQRAIDIPNLSVCQVDDLAQLPLFDTNDIVIDALLGSGLNQPVAGLMAGVIGYLNRTEAIRIAIDIPSGLPGEEALPDNAVAFNAHYTLTFQFPYLTFLFAESYPYVGQWFLLDIGLLTTRPTPFALVEARDITLKNRFPFTYKNEWGHALLLAGSRGMMGAAILSTASCIRTGCGLVTAHVPGHGGAIVHSTVPEAIVIYDPHNDMLTTLPDIKKYAAIGIGPGMGTHAASQQMLKAMLESSTSPLVIDADALNILALHPDWLRLLKPHTILTPHPGEFDRMFGKSQNSWQRFNRLREVAQTLRVIVVLKGRYTAIALPDGSCYFNTTGNPGMATAGSGDVLTGMILSLLSQGYTPEQAALFAVYLHGLAGDIAAQEKGFEALVASDIIKYIGKAFEEIRKSSSHKG